MGGIELFARHLAAELESRHRSITFCFSSPPSDVVRGLLKRANTRLIHLRDQESFSLTAAWELWRVLRSARAATVVYSFGSIQRPLPWVCKLAGVKRVIYNDHASRLPDDDISSPVKRAIARIITRPVTSVVAVSAFVASRSHREGMHNAPVLVIPNGVDIGRRAVSASRQDFLARYAIPSERRIVSQLSWLIKEKGVDIFLMAAAEVLRDRHDIHFVVGGEGASRGDYEQLASKLGISANVTFTRQIEDPMTSGLYQATEIFCLASRWSEACGLVLLEAMSFGVPVVASRVGGIPEFVRDGSDGLLVRPSASDFGVAISALLCDEDRRRRMGASARERVEKAFDVRLMAERYAKLLTEAR